MDGAAAVAETTYTPFRTEPDAAPARLIVRRVQGTPGSQWALRHLQLGSRLWNWRPTIAATIENASGPHTAWG